MKDEYANGIDNGAFTLASASKMLTFGNYFRELYGYEVNETWNDMALNIGIPYDDSGITIEYLGMNNSVPVKQADVVLNTFPLNYKNNYTEEQSLADLDYVSFSSPPPSLRCHHPSTGAAPSSVLDADANLTRPLNSMPGSNRPTDRP